jgi:hypothetical protein
VATEQDTEILQILRSQLGKCFPLDLILAEGKLVSLEAEVTQPDRYVHHAPSNLQASIWIVPEEMWPKTTQRKRYAVAPDAGILVIKAP